MKISTLAFLWLLGPGIGLAEVPLPPAISPSAAAEEINGPAPVRGQPGDGAEVRRDQEIAVIRFNNGDKLHGFLLSIAPDRGIRWRHPDARELITFSDTNVAEIALGAKSGRPPRTDHTIVTLTNGDQFNGEIVGLDRDTFTLDTGYAGLIRIRRPMVQRITPNLGRLDTVFTGPAGSAGLDGWTRTGNPNSWVYQNGAFYSMSPGSLGRDVKLPDAATIEFDLAWRGYLQFQFGFCSDNIEQLYAGGGYLMQVNNTSVLLQRGRPNQGFNNLDNGIAVDAFGRKTKVRLGVRLDRTKKIVALYVDGILAHKWSDPNDLGARGTGMVFQSQGGDQLRIANVVVAQWDGRLDNSDDGAGATPDNDLIRLVNSDKVSGKLEAIAKNQVTFVTAYATLNVPLERVAQIDLAGKDAELARRRATDVRSELADGGRITVALEQLDDQALVGRSENVGQLRLAREALRRLQFHIYDETAENSEDDNWSLIPGNRGGLPGE